uniref:hypothetical protein n=1 Tax=Succinivibrio sp. TaxID=2053619 RepID=UPI003FF068AB
MKKLNVTTKEDDSVERRTLVATAPKQVLVWDITYLYKTNPQGEYYYLYAVMDLYSRKMLHWEVHDIQSAEIAAKFKRWQMPKNAVVMSFYSKRSKIKNKIRASKWTAVNLQWLVKKRC